MPINTKQTKAVQDKRKKTQLSGFEKTLTQQAHKDACCIHGIIKRHSMSGTIDSLRDQGGQIDVSNATDFQTAMDKVVKAQQTFEQLPSAIRKKFNNDPKELMNFVHDEKNKDEMYSLGLAIKPKYADDGQNAPETTETPSVSEGE